MPCKKCNLKHPQVVLGDEFFLPEIHIMADAENIPEEETNGLPALLKPAIFLGIALLVFSQLKK